MNIVLDKPSVQVRISRHRPRSIDLYQQTFLKETNEKWSNPPIPPDLPTLQHFQKIHQ